MKHTINASLTRGGMAITLGMGLGTVGCGQRSLPVAIVSGSNMIATAATVTAPGGQDGYAIGENKAKAKSGPVRLASFSYVSGPVSWRPSGSVGWARATTNQPLRQGAQIWAQNGSRGELMFDDGSTMRLAGGSLATLQDLSSDDRGEYTRVKMTNGLATLHSRNDLSVYQFDTPYAAIRSDGPSDLRIGAGSSVEVVCYGGGANINGRQGRTTLSKGDRCQIMDATSQYRLSNAPDPDDWDRFNQNREVIYSHRNRHVPQNIDLVSGNLDNYGDWHQDPSNGYVWAPRSQQAGWRPYHNGRWVWTNPWGWTWVANEQWGWAPYHYGTWVHEPYGWAWVPGPSRQYWSPAVVQFVDDRNDIGWVALSPREVVYPSAINIGFRSGDWSVNFSIGQAGSYYPSGAGRCSGRAWDNDYVNRSDNYASFTNTYNRSYYDGGSSFVKNSGFVPRNATLYAGLTLASRAAFTSGNGFRTAPVDPHGSIFRRGRSYGRAPSGSRISGPVTLRPNQNSYTPDRHFTSRGGPPQAFVQRQVFNGPNARQGGPGRTTHAQGDSGRFNSGNNGQRNGSAPQGRQLGHQNTAPRNNGQRNGSAPQGRQLGHQNTAPRNNGQRNGSAPQGRQLGHQNTAPRNNGQRNGNAPQGRQPGRQNIAPRNNGQRNGNAPQGRQQGQSNSGQNARNQAQRRPPNTLRRVGPPLRQQNGPSGASRPAPQRPQVTRSTAPRQTSNNTRQQSRPVQRSRPAAKSRSSQPPARKQPARGGGGQNRKGKG